MRYGILNGAIFVAQEVTVNKYSMATVKMKNNNNKTSFMVRNDKS